ncbi:MAG TPA: MMPL family transporter [Streptosporangiaceae bacterium]|nr:MMPL family transporter [Streptosporangiaceae bacterium]
MHTLFAAIGRTCARFSWLVVVAWLAATIAAQHFLPSLASVARQDAASALPAASPSLHAARLAAPFQNPGDTPVPVVIARDSGTLTAADTTAISRLAVSLAEVAHVRRVQNLGVSHDNRAALLEVMADVNLGTQGPEDTLAASLRHTIAGNGLPADLHAHLAGLVAAQADASKSSTHALSLALDLSIVFILALLLVVFRSLLAPLLTIAPAVLVTQLAGPVIAEAGRHGVQVTSLTQLMMLILVIGAGTDYGLFLVFRVREELRAGRSPKEAVAHALARVGESVTFSAATVMAAMLTLVAASSALYSSLGIPLAVAIGLMLLADLTLMPALLAIFGRAAFWPSRTAGGSGRLGWWGRTASRIVARPATTLAAGVLGFGLLALAVLGYTPGGFGSAPAAPAGSDSAAGNAALAAHFPTASRNPTQVLLRFSRPVWDGGLAPLAGVQRRLAAVPQFASLAGPLDINGVTLTVARLSALHAALGDPRALPALPPAASAVPAGSWAVYRAESQFISADGRTVMFDAGLSVGDPGSNAALGQVPAIRAAVATVARNAGAAESGVAGEAPANYDVIQASDQDLLHIFPVAVAVIGLLLALVMRSLVAPLYLVASVGLSYLAAFGLSVLVFQDAVGASGLPYIIPFLMFVFLLALGEDYNILVMTRIREEAHRVPLRQAVTQALERTGSTVTSAGLVLAGTFGVFAVVETGQPGAGVYQDILAALAIGILMDAFLVRTLLVPSTVALLGRWNWWPSAHGTAATAKPERGVPQQTSGTRSRMPA